MSTGTFTGTIVFPASPSGSNQSIPVGAPSITASSTTGATLSYEESAAKTLSVAQGDGVVTVSFDTVAAADFLYVGTDQAIDVKLDSSLTAISLEAGGFVMIYMGGSTSMTVQATTSNDATVVIVLLGD